MANQFGLVIAGIIIHYTNWYWLDAVFSIIIANVILLGTLSLLKYSLRLSLDRVPPGIDLQIIKTKTLKIEGIKDIHHIHVWAISTTENAMTAHLVLENDLTKEREQKIKHEFRHEMEHSKINHVTVETESVKENCEVEDC